MEKKIGGEASNHHHDDDGDGRTGDDQTNSFSSVGRTNKALAVIDSQTPSGLKR